MRNAFQVLLTVIAFAGAPACHGSSSGAPRPGYEFVIVDTSWKNTIPLVAVDKKARNPQGVGGLGGFGMSSKRSAPPAPGDVGTARPTARMAEPVSSPAPELRGFALPIAGSCLPRSTDLMPNARRPYRKGIHEGIDFYDSDNCVRISRGTEVLAAKAGRVARADVSFEEMSFPELARHLTNPNTEEALDRFRGRQVWIDHGDGVVTRYAHLSAVADGIYEGASVSKGQVIALVGESGTPTSLFKPGHEYHLHFEVRVGTNYFRKGMPASEVRTAYAALFDPSAWLGETSRTSTLLGSMLYPSSAGRRASRALRDSPATTSVLTHERQEDRQ
jgi:murein DD-endopeptidase MepM/ murein hydrolase activator NlpD